MSRLIKIPNVGYCVIFLIGTNVSCQNSNSYPASNDKGNLINSSMRNLIHADPFIGTFKGSIENNSVTIQISDASAEEYNFYFNGQGPDRIKKTGSIIKMHGAGVSFALEPNGEGLLLTGNGKNVILKRENQNEHQNNSEPSQTENDQFIGTYDMVANGQNLGKVSIKHTGGNNYKLTTGQGEDLAQKNGDQLLSLIHI